MKSLLQLATMVVAGCSLSLCAQTATITASFRLAAHPPTSHDSLEDVVMWLTPVDTTVPAPAPRSNFKLVQKNKEFIPHLLVVPAGSSVDFPNLDPFFHNVFSLFDGKRFDLGLYEAGSHRSVRFDREGVSYIFCNIHPQMGAVIIALTTPYYAQSLRDGSVAIHDVPAGRYRVHIWGEHFQAAAADQRILQVAAPSTSLGIVSLTPATTPLTNHKNKFGEPYSSTPTSKY